MTHDALVAVARAVFEAAGGTPVDPDYVLPADIPLELSGEAVRARLCVFTDNRGAEMAMRPDLTLPVAQREAARLEAGASPKTYTYAARAFRLPAAADDPFEFTQVGLERFGYGADASADAELFALVHRAVEACGVQPKAIVTGDLAIFPAFIEALGLPDVTMDLLKRAFRQEGGVRAVLDAASRPLDTDILAALDAGDPEAALGAVLAARDVPLVGARSLAEIIEGLKARRAAIEAGGLPEGARAALLALLRCGLSAGRGAGRAVGVGEGAWGDRCRPGAGRVCLAGRENPCAGAGRAADGGVPGRVRAAVHLL